MAKKTLSTVLYILPLQYRNRPLAINYDAPVNGHTGVRNREGFLSDEEGRGFRLPRFSRVHQVHCIESGTNLVDGLDYQVTETFLPPEEFFTMMDRVQAIGADLRVVGGEAEEPWQDGRWGWSGDEWKEA